MPHDTITDGHAALRKEKRPPPLRLSGAGMVSAASSAVQRFLAAEMNARDDRITKGDEQMPNKTATNGHAALRKEKRPPPLRPSGAGKVSAASSAVQRFLAAEMGARECRITKIAPVDHGSEGWCAEAEILVPNLDIKSLGLKLSTEILEQERYLVELDLDLIVRSFEFIDPNDSRA